VVGGTGVTNGMVRLVESTAGLHSLCRPAETSPASLLLSRLARTQDRVWRVSSPWNSSLEELSNTSTGCD
jgi:hypothetical protein